MKAGEHEALLTTLQVRFESNMRRHVGMAWTAVRERIAAQPKALATLQAMEASGGEPDLIAASAKDARLLFIDCAPESPSGRRSLCYDPRALASRKQNKPAGSALGMAATMGIELLDEAGFRLLQTVGEFDTRTSSWIQTPADIRELGGALFSTAATAGFSFTTTAPSPITRREAFVDHCRCESRTSCDTGAEIRVAVDV